LAFTVTGAISDDVVIGSRVPAWALAVRREHV
jgi:hypothetical protein